MPAPCTPRRGLERKDWQPRVIASVIPGARDPCRHRQQLCVLVVQAFVRAVPRRAPLPTDGAAAAAAAATGEGAAPAVARAARLLPALRQLPLVGQPVGESELIDGVLLDLPRPLALAAGGAVRACPELTPSSP